MYLAPFRSLPSRAHIHSVADFSLTSTYSVSARLRACVRINTPDHQFNRGICWLQPHHTRTPVAKVMAINSNVE